jgi:hypothetical protein
VPSDWVDGIFRWASREEADWMPGEDSTEMQQYYSGEPDDSFCDGCSDPYCIWCNP